MNGTKRFFVFLLAAALCAFSFGALADKPGASYLGRALPDFTVNTIDGNVFTLSEALKEKDMVLINLWATWCPPCKMEFPFLEQAYEQYRDQVEVIALSVETNDTPAALKKYAESNGLSFPIGSDSTVGLGGIFATAGIPTSLVVDRFGNVAFIEVGAQIATGAFSRLFSAFVGDAYTETRVLDAIPPLLPTVDAASPDELAAALNIEGGNIVFSNSGDQMAWPMLPAEKDGRTIAISSNGGAESSASVLLAQVTAAEGDALAFDFFTDTEPLGDLLTIGIDGKIVKSFSGVHDWTAWALPLTAGEHSIAFRYEKDEYTDGVLDIVCLDNVRLVSGEEARGLLSALPAYPAAEETSLRIVTDGVREIRFDDPGHMLDEQLGCDSYWIANSSSVEVFATITEDCDPEAAYLISSYTLSPVSLAASVKGDGYACVTGIDSPDTTGYICTVVYLGLKNSGQSDQMLCSIGLFAGEDEVNALAAHLASNGGVLSWSYAEENAEREYIVRFRDQNGDPVPGCIVNFCTDEACMPAVADETGTARFTGAPYAYHLQVLMVPAGYAFDTAQEFWTAENGGEITLTVAKE